MSFPKSIVSFMLQRPLLLRSFLERTSTYATIPARFVQSKTVLNKPIFCLSRAYHMPVGEADITQRPKYDELVQRVLKVVKAHEKLKPEQVQLESHYMKDLGLDSLDQVEILLAVEEEFDLQIPDDISDRLMRSSEVVSYLAERLKVEPQSSANASSKQH